MNSGLPINNGEVDPISDVLDSIRLRGTVFFLWEPCWPFGTGVAEGATIARELFPDCDNVISYHIVTEGECWGAIEGEEPVHLTKGDILVLPRGDRYKISNKPVGPSSDEDGASLAFFKLLKAGEIPPVVATGGPGPNQSKLICGFLSCNLKPYNPLLSTMPAILRVSATNDDNDPISSLINFALTETRKTQGGERCLLLRLSETLFVEVIRRYLRTVATESPGWLSGLRHPLVGRALVLLHDRFNEHWTVEKLAKAVGTSRSSLAELFSAFVGESPMNYLIRWRMQIAANLLREGRLNIISIANKVGYESEAAFSRAFKREVGVNPSVWRKQRDADGHLNGYRHPINR